VKHGTKEEGKGIRIIQSQRTKSKVRRRGKIRSLCQLREAEHTLGFIRWRPRADPDRPCDPCFDRFVYILTDEENKVSVSSAPSFLWIFGLGWYHLTSDCDIEALSLDSRIRPLAFGPGPHVMTIDDDNGERRAGSTYSPSKLVKSGKKELVIIAV
jgi:hypothetical protein